MLLLRGFEIIGAIVIGDGSREKNAGKAVEISRKMRECLHGPGEHDLIGATTDLMTDDVHFFVSCPPNIERMEVVSSVIYEDNPEKYIWDKGCLLRCNLEFKLPIFIPLHKTSGAFLAVSKLKLVSCILPKKDLRIICSEEL